MRNTTYILDTLPPREPADPKKDFLKGVLYAFFYYASGLSLAALSYSIVGHPYIHAPGLHHLILLVTFSGGLLWALAGAVAYLSGKRSWELGGIVSTNTVAVLTFIMMIASSVHEEYDYRQSPGDEISTSQSGDTTLLYHNDNIIYMKVKDSVLLNFIDSARFRAIVDSTGIKRRETP